MFYKSVIGRAQTKVGIRFSGQPRTHVPYELIPMLVIGNTYEGKETFPPKTYDELKTTIHKRTGEYQDDDGTWWMTYQDNQKTLHIRQLELARALFLHNPHLIRAAFRPNGLGSIANARHIDDYFSEIQFHVLADYPASNLLSRSTLDHLIWLYFDEMAKRSFHSIYNCLQDESSEIWHFHFTPPNLNGWRLETCGRWLNEQDFVTDSIKAIGHPGFDFIRGVNFKHPRFKVPVAREQGGNGGKNHTPPDKDPELDIPATPGLRQKLHRQHDKTFRFSISHASTTSVVGKNSPRGGAKPDESNGPKEVTGLGHGQPGGTAREFDYGINRSEDSNSEEQLNDATRTARFALFEKAIESLVTLDGYTFHRIQCVSLPQPANGNGAYRRTHDHQPASCHVATLYLNETIFVIAEIDTESFLSKKSLSTLVVSLRGDASTALLEILKGCSEKGVSWDRAKIANHSTIFSTCRHPPRERSKKDGGENIVTPRTDEDFLGSWVDILNSTLQSCYYKIQIRK